MRKECVLVRNTECKYKSCDHGSSFLTSGNTTTTTNVIMPYPYLGHVTIPEPDPFAKEHCEKRLKVWKSYLFELCVQNCACL